MQTPDIILSSAPRWRLDDRSPWPSTDAVLRLGLDALPHLADDDARALVALLLGALADAREELRAVREVQFAALTHAHAQHLELIRLRARLTEQRDAARQEAA